MVVLAQILEFNHGEKKQSEKGFQWFDSGVDTISTGQGQTNLNVDVSIRCTMSFYFLGGHAFLLCSSAWGGKKK